MTRDVGVSIAVAVVVVTAAVGAFAAPAGARQADDPTPEFVVDLNTDGSAQFTASRVYNLSNASQRARFQELQNNQTARAAARSAFQDRMARIAANASTKTGREMSVGDASVGLSEEDNFGIVEFSISYEGLAAVENDGELKITEPFATVLGPDRRLVFNHPEDWRYSFAQPPPDDGGLYRVVYEPDAQLNRYFQLGFVDTESTPTPSPTASPTPSPSPAGGDGGDGGDGSDGGDSGDGNSDGSDGGDDGSSDGADGDGDAGDGGTSNGGGPGFGALAAVTALVGLALLAVRRRD